MTTTPLQTVLCHYRYDALDRSITWTPDRQAGLQRFFCKDRLATEIQNAAQRSIFQQDEHVLAQQNRWGDKVDTTLLATDQQRSVLTAADSVQAHRIAYTPFGHRSLESGLLSLLGFNGERPDLVTGHYHLGHGYRQFNPVLMRFNSPDKLSPFGKGGINAYAYCGNDPVNWIDPNGSVRFLGFGKIDISTKEANQLVAELLNNNPTITNRNQVFRNQSTNTLQTMDLSNHSRKSLIKIHREAVKYLEDGRANLTSKKVFYKGMEQKFPEDRDALSKFNKYIQSLPEKAYESRININSSMRTINEELGTTFQRTYELHKQFKIAHEIFNREPEKTMFYTKLYNDHHRSIRRNESQKAFEY
ncbi:RHS repeat-associated core domain-containing protein|uniref:RHS repeat-associated core domain-containing protein n=1 Tax=Pseudomonas sp. SbOxS1 TaxID=2723884 RepID=UPI0015D383F6|nr:RHS repeat-associated core domain-containing protein [Pseudomonas sp. SbOxS1]NYU06234.1 RHS repeat-associated core domain-containing protein [Pseudomonas sp. SbOxS1]